MAVDPGKPTNQPHAHPHHHAHIQTVDAGMPIGQILIVGGIVALLGGGGLWYLDRKGEDTKLNTLFKSQDTRKITTNNGQRGNVTLSDGSILSVGPATKLTIIPEYNTLYRGVQVNGTAGFDVKPSAGVPLEVRAGGGIFVLDEGAFVVRSYEDEGDATFKLTSGSVQVRAKDARLEITAPALLYIGKDSTVSDADSVAVDIATSWVDGTVKFVDMPIRGLLPLLNKYYALSIELTDEALLSRTVTMEASLESKQMAIDALEKAAFVKFAYNGTTPTLKDDPAAAARAARAAKK
ncbi:MAG: FecR domain-containing protein [Gemmatimonadetes bacterium]|nr:FecR domain-containing protein [Gemmatimonadota bacterium]